MDSLIELVFSSISGCGPPTPVQATVFMLRETTVFMRVPSQIGLGLVPKLAVA